jgi:hypothetical protein
MSHVARLLNSRDSWAHARVYARVGYRPLIQYLSPIMSPEPGKVYFTPAYMDIYQMMPLISAVRRNRAELFSSCNCCPHVCVRVCSSVTFITWGLHVRDPFVLVFACVCVVFTDHASDVWIPRYDLLRSYTGHFHGDDEQRLVLLFSNFDCI